MIDIHDAKAFLKSKEMKGAVSGGNFFMYQNMSFKVQCMHEENYITQVDIYLLKNNKATDAKTIRPLKYKDKFIEYDRFKRGIEDYITQNSLVYFEDFYDKAILLNGFLFIRIVVYLYPKYNYYGSNRQICVLLPELLLTMAYQGL